MDKTNKDLIPTPPMYMPVWQPPDEDEINLLDLWHVLVMHKVWIVWVTLVVTLGAVGYAFLATPEYRAKVLFLPPSQHHIEPLKGASVSSVYALFERNLNSKALQYAFFVESRVRDQWRQQAEGELVDEKLFEDFQARIEVETNKKEKGSLALVVGWENAATAAQLANNYTQQVQTATVKQLLQDRQAVIQQRIQQIDGEISAKRASAKQRRLDQIARLQESADIADQLGLLEPSEGALASSTGKIEIHTAHKALYLRGSKALKAELSALKARVSNDPYIGGLRDLQEERDQLKGVMFNPKQIQAASVDQAAYPPTDLYKPKRGLIVALGIVLGLMLGAFVAFFVDFVQKQRSSHDEENTATG
jgi:chain length determinant protein (polysaccharide antigen chain regulator)